MAPGQVVLITTRRTREPSFRLPPTLKKLEFYGVYTNCFGDNSYTYRRFKTVVSL